MHSRPDDGGMGLARQPHGVLVRVKMLHARRDDGGGLTFSVI
jgi:hypothetical protein